MSLRLRSGGYTKIAVVSIAEGDDRPTTTNLDKLFLRTILHAERPVLEILRTAGQRLEAWFD